MCPTLRSTAHSASDISARRTFATFCAERLRLERDRLERDEAIYSMGECDAEMRFYGNEVRHVVEILRKALADLEQLKTKYD